jgi:hypothetical protein
MLMCAQVEDEYDDNVFDEEEEEEEEENEEGGHLHMTNAEVQKLTLEVGHRVSDWLSAVVSTTGSALCC